MSRLVLAAELAEMLAPEYAEVRAGLMEAGCDDKRVLQLAQQAYWAMRRVELEEWGESPWAYCWPLAHLRNYEHMIDVWLGVTEYDRETFHDAHEHYRKQWLADHPEWQAAQDARAAEAAGRLF